MIGTGFLYRVARISAPPLRYVSGKRGRAVEFLLLEAGLLLVTPALLLQMLVQRKPAVTHGPISERIYVNGASKLLG